MKIETALGDIWHIENGRARPDCSSFSYGLSESMQRLLNMAEKNPISAKKLRVIEDAPLDLEGSNILVPDPNYPGWSRAINIDNPELNWKQQSIQNGDHLFLSDDPAISAKRFVSEPGVRYGDWTVYVRDGDDYAPAANFGSFYELEEWFLSDATSNALPPISSEKTTIIELCKGYKAEVIYEIHVRNNRIETYSIDILDKVNRLVAQCYGDINYIVELRDNERALEQALVKYRTNETPELDFFRSLNIEKPDSIEAVYDLLNDLRDQKCIKLTTASEEYELILSWQPQKCIRDGNGKRLVLGSHEISPETLKSCTTENIHACKERAYNITLKRAHGAYFKTIEGISISLPKLAALVTDISAEETLIRFAKLRNIQFEDNKLTGLAPSAHQLLAVAIQGSRSDIHYLTNNEYKCSDLLKNHAMKRNRAANQEFEP